VLDPSVEVPDVPDVDSCDWLFLFVDPDCESEEDPFVLLPVLDPEDVPEPDVDDPFVDVPDPEDDDPS
jgi:hypothetical protein